MKLKTDGGFIDFGKFIDALHDWTAKTVYGPLLKRVAALETEVKELQGRGTLKYHGVYAPDGDYRKGDACTYAGSLWVARENTTARPGTGPEWQLAVKRGKDGGR